METKICARCGLEKSVSNYSLTIVHKNGKRYLQSYCKKCSSKYSLELRHRTGKIIPMREARDCSAYLGIHIAERALSDFFDQITRMPTNNPGFDFLCGRGFKIDVKSACLRESNKGTTAPRWNFHIRKNDSADYFLCLGFNNRQDLEPLHVWLIPGNRVNDHNEFTITNNQKSLSRWIRFERPLDRVLSCCNNIRGVT